MFPKLQVMQANAKTDNQVITGSAVAKFGKRSLWPEGLEMIAFACRSLFKILALSLFGFVSLSPALLRTVRTFKLPPDCSCSARLRATLWPPSALMALCWWERPRQQVLRRISSILASHTRSPVRYVVIAPEDPAHSEGDAGWAQRGAFVAMQENELRGIGGNVMGAPQPLPKRFIELGVYRPQ